MSKPKDKLWVGPELPGGKQPFLRETGDGEQTGGLLLSNPAGADSLVELEHVQGCLYEVRSEVRFTAAGPSQVSTGAYRSGWDRVFGGKAQVGQA